MYSYALDKFTACMVGILSPKPVVEQAESNEKMEHSITTLAAIKPPMGQAVFILSVDPDWPAPSAKERKRFAELKEQNKYPQIFMLHSPSALIRGVTIAVNWLTPKKEGSPSLTCASMEEGFKDVEALLKRDLPILRRLYIDAQAGMRARPH